MSVHLWSKFQKNRHVKVQVGGRQSLHRYLPNFRWIPGFHFNFIAISIDLVDYPLTPIFVIYRFLPFRNFELRKIGQNDRIR